MPVESSEVKIVISVQDKDSGQVIAGLEQNLQSMGNAGSAAGNKVGKGMDAISGHSLTALDNVRLLRDDIGIRLPRSMEKAIASNKMLMSAIGGLGPAMLAVGSIDIGVRIAEGLHSAYEKYVDLNAAQAKYFEELMKARSEDFGNTRSIEDTRVRIQSATEDIQSMDRAIQRIQSRNWLTRPLNQWLDAANFSELRVQRQQELTKLSAAGAEQQHQLTVQAIGRDHSSAGLTGAAARQANYQRRLAEIEENQKYAAAQDRLLHNATSSNAGQAEADVQRQIALKDLQGENANSARTQAQETRRMEAEARDASLRGEAVYMAQRDRMLDQLREKLKETELSPAQYARQAAAVNERYDNERMKRLEDMRRETEMMQGEAALAGFRGAGRLQAQGDLDIARINGSDLPQDVKDQRTAAVKTRVNNELIQSEQEYSRQVDALADQTADHQVSAIGRIRAEAERAINEKRKAFEEQTGQINRSTPEGEQAYQGFSRDFQRESGLIRSGANQQAADQMQRYQDETEQLESEARARSLAAEKRQTQAIDAEYQERFKKIEEWKTRELESTKLTEAERAQIQDQAGRREAAAMEMRNAQMEEAAKAAREKMAGEFSSFFRSLDHPTEALKSLGDRVAGQAAAALVQRMQNHFGGGASSAGNRNPLGQDGILDKVFGRIAGHASGGVASTHTAVHEAARTMSLATAQINIQSATLNLGGGGAMSGFARSGSTAVAMGAAAEGSTSGAYGYSAGGSTAAGVALGDVAGRSAANVTSADSSAGPSSGGGFVGSGAPGSTHSSLGSAVSGVRQGMALYSQAKHIFGAKSSAQGQLAETQSPNVDGAFDKDGNFVAGGKSDYSQSMMGGNMSMSNVAGAAGGAVGLYSAYEGNGGWGGAASGAMSGMQLGMAVGGPMGAAVGAAAGAIVGAIGFGGREKARVYWLKQGRPRMQNDTDSYQQGGMDYLSAMQDIESLKAEANRTTNAMGPAAKSYYQDTIKREISQSEANLTREQKAGRSDFSASAAQYDIGTDAVPRDGFAMIHKDERIIPSDQNERITRALEGGADGKVMPAASGFGGDVHLHVHAIDAKGVAQFFNSNKHQLRSALNASFAENSGGADA